MSGHTPGPWTVETDYDGIFVLMGPLKGEDEHLAVYTAPYNDGENPSYRRVADARLIAEAPAMYEALLNAEPAIEAYVRVGRVINHPDTNKASAVLDAVREVLARLAASRPSDQEVK